MSRRAQKLPEEYQEGSYKRRKSGKVVNVGKPIKSSTRNASGATSEHSQPPPVPLQHFGEQNDMDTGLDYLDLDSELPSLEEVRRSYGKVSFQMYLQMDSLRAIPKTQNQYMEMCLQKRAAYLQRIIGVEGTDTNSCIRCKKAARWRCRSCLGQPMFC